MDRVTENQETIIVERSGKPQLVLISLDEYRALPALRAAQTPSWMDLVMEARRQVAEDLGERRLPPSEEIIREMREERDAHLSSLR